MSKSSCESLEDLHSNEQSFFFRPNQVPESDGMLSQILRFIDALSTQGTSTRAEPITSLSKALPNDAENPYGDLDEQYKSVSMMEKFASRDAFWRSSLSSSYWSPSSTTTSSSALSAGDQKGNSNNTAVFLLNTTNNDGRPLSPAGYLQTRPNSMDDRLGECGILQDLDHIDMHDVNTPISVQEFDGYQLNYAEFIAPCHSSHEQHLDLSNRHHYFSSPSDVIGTSPLPSLLDIPHYASSGGKAATSSLVDCGLQPIECADEWVNDTHHCVNKIVEGPSKKPYIEYQTGSHGQLPVASISCLPSITCQGASHSASHGSNQWQQWRQVHPGVTEVAEGMTDLFGQSEQDTHAMVTTVISETPLVEYSFAGKRLEADLDPKIVALVQDAALTIENEGSSGQNSKMAASLTVPSKTQAAGSSISYKCGSEKAAGSSLATEGSYISHEFGAVHEDYKIVRGSSGSQLAAAGNYASYASGSAEPHREASMLRSQSAGGYVSYVSSSAEAEKVVGSSTGFLSRQGAGTLMIGSGTRAQQNGEFLDGLQQALQGLQDDRYAASANCCTNIGTLQESNLNFAISSPVLQNDAAIHHMHAERERRRKESYCINTLRTLINVPNISKKHPKVAILESTIHYLKELKARIHELEQENVSLINIKLKSKSNSTKDVCNLLSNLEHATNGKGSIQGKVYNKSAIGHCIYSSSAENTIPYFQFILTKNVQDIKANATINGILNSLQSKNLCCYEINYEFCKNANKLFINILANYKDGENQSPSLDVIEGIKEWWNNLIKD